MMCIGNVMRHSFAVPCSGRETRCAACVGKRHPKESVAGQTSRGRHASALFLNGSSKCVERIHDIVGRGLR